MISGSTLLSRKTRAEFCAEFIAAMNPAPWSPCQAVRAERFSKPRDQLPCLTHSDENDRFRTRLLIRPRLLQWFPAALAAGEQFTINGTRLFARSHLATNIGPDCVTMTIGSSDSKPRANGARTSIRPLFEAAAAASCDAGLNAHRCGGRMMGYTGVVTNRPVWVCGVVLESRTNISKTHTRWRGETARNGVTWRCWSNPVDRCLRRYIFGQQG